jgi:hypothetical protein
VGAPQVEILQNSSRLDSHDEKGYTYHAFIARLKRRLQLTSQLLGHHASNRAFSLSCTFCQLICMHDLLPGRVDMVRFLQTPIVIN